MKLILLTALVLASLPLLAQTPRPETAPLDTANRKQPYYILLRDGSFIQGRIVRRDSTMFTIRLRGGQLSYVEQALFDRITDQRPPDNPTDEPAGQPIVDTQPERLSGPPTGPQQYTFTLRDGRKIRGEVIRQDSTGTVVRTRNLGEVRIPPDKLVRQEAYYQAQPLVAKSDVGATYVITMRDNRQFRGQILRRDSAEVQVRTRDLGDVRIPANQIARLVKVGGSSSTATYPNIFTQSLFWAPTAFMPETGKVYYNQQFTAVSQFDVGITKNWSASGSFFTFLPPLGYSFSTKVAFPVNEQLRLGVQAQYLGSSYGSGPELRGSIGYLQGIATLGSAERNTTIGAGWTVSGGDLAQNALVTVSIVRKIRPRTTLISQNQAIIGQGWGTRNSLFLGLVSGGVRFNNKNHALDLLGYAFIIAYRNQTVPFPSVWVTYRLKINP